MIDIPYRLAILVLVLFQVLIAFLLFRRARRRYTGARLKWAVAGLLAVMVFVLAGLSLEIGRVRARVAGPYYEFTILRMSVSLWLFASAAAFAGNEVISRLARRRGKHTFDPQRRRLLLAARAGVISAPFAAIGYGCFIERTNFRTVQVDVPVAGLHPDLDGLRVVQLSDIHLSPTLSENELAYVIDAANQLRPHLAVVTGDLITKSRDPVDACLRQIGRLRADAGLLGCMGNHETLARVERYLQRAGPKVGIDFLRKDRRELRFGGAILNVAGVDYESFRKRGRYLQGCEFLVQPGAFNLLLSHNPDVIPAAAAKGFDLTLAGHMHGGQINFEIMHSGLNIARFYSPYVYGRYTVRAGNRDAYGFVTRGVGTIALPLRVGAPPEIALIRLRRT